MASRKSRKGVSGEFPVKEKANTISTIQLAALLGISRQRVNELARKGKIQREADRRWNLSRVRTALKQNLDGRQAAPSLGKTSNKGTASLRSTDSEPAPGSPQSLLEAQRRHEWLKVQKEELELRRRQGELIEACDIEQTWTHALTAFKNRLLLVPDKLAAKVAVCPDVLECRELIDREIKEAIKVLADAA